MPQLPVASPSHVSGFQISQDSGYTYWPLQSSCLTWSPPLFPDSSWIILSSLTLIIPHSGLFSSLRTFQALSCLFVQQGQYRTWHLQGLSKSSLSECMGIPSEEVSVLNLMSGREGSKDLELSLGPGGWSLWAAGSSPLTLRVMGKGGRMQKAKTLFDFSKELQWSCPMSQFSPVTSSWDWGWRSRNGWGGIPRHPHWISPFGHHSALPGNCV